MFDKSAQLYDVIYSFKDYEQEAEQIRDYMHSRHPEAKTVLDVACGTGRHVEYLNRDYNVDGIDLNKEFVALAQQRNPDSSFWCEDMTRFDVGRKYDVVMCLFSSIAYAKTLDAVVRTVQQFSNHLEDGGLILIEPWFTPKAWQPGFVSMIQHKTEEYQICRMTHADTENELSILNFEYLIGSKTGIEHRKERHELGLFGQKELTQAFESIGMKVEYDPVGLIGRGMYVLRPIGGSENGVL
ncbi:class I SAM-dependent methyltransferase [Paenibacillus sp. SC116]|uniref:class I SAM-dependent DNA methyltransferase n=1 Tax=Paenibacillus sp. SC116 TaxID=2968986 RepID=UPI00215A9E15|nr:class I SAM-dependent methyltransferase [Paenibacillus sp. SC116]MCR8845885.1 class I SAM-dependent methyltransferase [Paenibacillus sp. SC116]